MLRSEWHFWADRGFAIASRAGSGGPEASGLDVVLLDLVAQDPEAGV